MAQRELSPGTLRPTIPASTVTVYRNATTTVPGVRTYTDYFVDLDRRTLYGGRVRSRRNHSALSNAAMVTGRRSLPALGDAYVNGSNASALRQQQRASICRRAGFVPARRAVSAGRVLSARCRSANTSGNGSFNLHTTSGLGESSITYNNAPSLGAGVGVGSFGGGSWTAVDTPDRGQRQANFAMTGNSNTATLSAARCNPPRVMIELVADAARGHATPTAT